MPDSEHLRSDEDVEAILRLAVRGTDTSSDQLRDRLKAAADELGISEDQLARAEEQYKRELEGEQLEKYAQEEDDRLWKEFRRTQLHDFMSHFGVYLAVNLGLFAMDWFQGGGIQWAFWPMFGWGIAIVIHLATMMSPYSGENVEEFEKWKGKRARKVQKANKRVLKSAQGVDDQVMDLMLAGRKIEAIKVVRDETGMGLKEAKEYVEQAKFRL